MKRPPAYPTELAYPCCLPALGELGKMPPHGGLAPSVGEPLDGHQDGTHAGGFHGSANRPVLSSAEDSPSGLWRSLGKRVGLIALRGSNPLSSATPERRRTTCGAVRGSGSGLGQQHSPLQGVRIPYPPPLPNGVAPRAAPFAVPGAPTEAPGVRG